MSGQDLPGTLHSADSISPLSVGFDISPSAPFVQRHSNDSVSQSSATLVQGPQHESAQPLLASAHLESAFFPPSKPEPQIQTRSVIEHDHDNVLTVPGLGRVGSFDQFGPRNSWTILP